MSTKATARRSTTGRVTPTRAAKAVIKHRAEVSIPDRVWDFFTSVKVAMVLLLVLAAISVAGSLIIQVPEGIRPGSPDYALWLNQVRPKFGAWTDVLDKLQLFYIFNTLWFKGLLAALVVSIAACSLNRLPAIWHTITKPPIQVTEAFLRRGDNSAEIALPRMSQERASQALASTLASSGYRVLEKEEKGVKYLYAEKNRYARLGTFLTHLSIILFLVGVMLGRLGFRNSELILAEGSTRVVGFGTGLSIELESFEDEWYIEGPPKDFRSQVVLYENGTEVRRATVRVNEPLEYNGVRFFQSFYGPAAILKVENNRGDVLYEEGVPLAWKYLERPSGGITLPQEGVSIYLVGTSSGAVDTIIRPGQVLLMLYQGAEKSPIAAQLVDQGKAVTIDDLTYTFVRERQFSGLQVARDPGTPIVWIASTLLTLGLVLVFYFPHRRLWGLCRKKDDGKTQVLLGAGSRRDVSYGWEFRRIVEGVEALLVKRKEGTVNV